jgi:hypothetical protein
LTLDASFLTVPIARGFVVKVECHIGTTGARFELIARRATVQSLTDGTSVDASYENDRLTSSSQKLAPSLSSKAPPSELKLELGSSEATTSASRKVTFPGKEQLLAVTHVGDSGVRWSIRPHRGERAVVDYLEGTVRLEALARWTEGRRPHVEITAQTTDIRFFGPDGRVLSRPASVGLWVKLHLLGMAMPSREIRRHTVKFSNHS